MPYKLTLTITDTNYYSLVKALEEVLSITNANEDKIQWHEDVNAADKYDMENDKGSYELSINFTE